MLKTLKWFTPHTNIASKTDLLLEHMEQGEENRGGNLWFIQREKSPILLEISVFKSNLDDCQ